ncbi:hypothetical protein SH2C18_21960 [Clostridium sediminicola]|uniref:lectin like domain-containing protein n=1 Tax=Clostridium sediminicola TaxID=3114879 RepID=UPI0031F205E7
MIKKRTFNRYSVIKLTFIFMISINLLFTVNIKAVNNLPKKYDSRDYGYTSSVKDQGMIGACWSFASNASLEAFLLKNNEREINLSENNMINNHDFSLGANGGGNISMATAYYTSWAGPVLEKDDPYPDRSIPKNIVSREVKDVVKHIQEVLFIPKRNDFLDNDGIKKAVMEYGSVTSIMHEDSKYYNSHTNSYYSNNSEYPNHQISIVGWDDTYPAENFNTQPEGDGAFIIKNSYGTSWGNNGFNYISYYDNVIGNENAVFIAEENNNYDNIYQYDPFGMTSRIGYGIETAWFANVFTAKGELGEKLKAISFYTTKKNASYEVYFSNTSKPVQYGDTNKKISSGTIEMPGYHTIELGEEQLLTPKEQFTIVVKTTIPGEERPIPMETIIEGYTDKAKSNSGESYISYNGLEWEDLENTNPNSNVNLKAFTVDVDLFAITDIKKVNGWSQSGQLWRYYKEGIAQKELWIQDTLKQWYYVGTDGYMLTSSWVNDITNQWYYLDANGVMVSNQWIESNGKWYYLNHNGDMAVNTVTVDGYRVGIDGAWEEN